MSVDPFTPWQEDPDTLRRRTVGREAALRWLVDACNDFLTGGPPSWRLVAGPRGIGKSHLLQLAWNQLSDPDVVTWVGEDTPAPPTAEALWRALSSSEDPWGWTPPQTNRPKRRILFVEGFDRLVGALKKNERWKLRHLLQESGALFIGTALTPSIAAGEGSAFFGQLDAWTLQSLTLADAEILFRAVSREPIDAPANTLTRRAALVRLAGGSPRALLALAEAVRGAETDEVGTAKGLLSAVQHLVPHYQQRFFDLPPLGQKILQVLAQAPRAMLAGEVQRLTHSSSAAVSGAARVLETAGTLTRSTDPKDARSSRYSLSEPMFRYWLEYRTTPSWDNTRISWFAQLLGEVFTRDEVTNVWWGAPEGKLRDAAAQAAEYRDLSFKVASKHLATEGGSKEALTRLLELNDEQSTLDALELCVDFEASHLLPHLLQLRSENALATAICRFHENLHDQSDASSGAFSALITDLHAARSSIPTWAWGRVSRLVATLMQRTTSAEPPWKSLSKADIDTLLEVPVLRVQFAVQGRLATHPPLVPWARLSTLSNPESDAASVLEAAHLHNDGKLLRHASGTLDFLPYCPAPFRPAVDPDAILCHVTQSPSKATLTWVATFAGVSDERFAGVLDTVKSQDMEKSPTKTHLYLAAYLALGVRSMERLDALARCVANDDPTMGTARRVLRQFGERANGPLQHELELVWQAVAPDEQA